jgi:hypothetical protein
MAASTVFRSTLTDDDGSGTTGSIWNEAELSKIYDSIDLALSGTGAYTTLEMGGNILADGTLAGTGGLTGRIKSFTEDVTSVTFSGTPTFDLSASNNFKLGVLTAAVTAITISNWPSRATSVVLRFTQDGTGGRSVTFPAGWKWAAGVVPVPATTLNKSFIVILYSDDGGTTIFATLLTDNA